MWIFQLLHGNETFVRNYFKDLWHFKNPHKDGRTWCDSENTSKSRIDYIFAKNINLNQIKTFVVRHLLGTHRNNTRMSDHRYLKICANFNTLERGSGYWKLNISHLEKEDYKEGIDSIFNTLERGSGYWKLNISHLEKEDYKEGIDSIFNTLERGSGYWKLNISHLEKEDYKEGIDSIFNQLDDTLDTSSKWDLFTVKVRDFSILYAKQSKNNLRYMIRSTEKEIDYIENLSNSEI